MCSPWDSREYHLVSPTHLEIGSSSDNFPSSTNNIATAATNVFPVLPPGIPTVSSSGFFAFLSPSPTAARTMRPSGYRIAARNPGIFFLARAFSSTATRSCSEKRDDFSCASDLPGHATHTSSARIVALIDECREDAAGLSDLSSGTENLAAWLLVVGAGLLFVKDLANWLLGVEDEFASRGIGLALGTIMGPVHSAGLVILLSIWFAVSFGLGILWVEPLNRFRIGGFPLGFWFSQQGAIYVFIVLTWVYARWMDRVDERLKEDRDRE